jgi:uncharacterized Zn-finger protein
VGGNIVGDSFEGFVTSARTHRGWESNQEIYIFGESLCDSEHTTETRASLKNRTDGDGFTISRYQHPFSAGNPQDLRHPEVFLDIVFWNGEVSGCSGTECR